MVDVETLQPLKLWVEVEYVTRRGEVRKKLRMSPLFQKTNDVWRRITVKNEDYFKLNFELQSVTNLKFLFVKKKFFHQIDIRELKKIVMAPISQLSVEGVEAVLRATYPWVYLQGLLRELGALPDTPGSTHGDLRDARWKPIVFRYLTAFYKILKKGKSSLLPIYFRYFLDPSIAGEVPTLPHRPANFREALNAKMIVSFEFFLSLFTQK